MVHTPARAALFSRSIESSPRPKRVDIIAGYFRLGSVFHVAAMVITLTFAIRHCSTFYALAAPYFLRLLLWPAYAAAWWWTGSLIARRQRSGAWMAIASITVPLLTGIFTHRPGVIASIISGAIGLAAIASVWKELE